jgi:hypothetical protein
MKTWMYVALVLVFALSLSYVGFEMWRFTQFNQRLQPVFRVSPLPVHRDLSTNVSTPEITKAPTISTTKPTTRPPTTSISSLHIRAYRPNEYIVHVNPSSLDDLFAYDKASIPVYTHTHFPASLLPNSTTLLPALPSYIKTFSTYQYNPVLQVIELKVNRTAPHWTSPLDVMLANETRCMSSLALSAQNHALQILRGLHKTLSGPCAPCLITLRHSTVDKTIFSFLRFTEYSNVFGTGFRPYFGATDNNYFFVKSSLSRCDNVRTLFNIF